MTDVFTKKKRSDVMSRIRGKGNKSTEGALVDILRAQHITGWRRHAALPGRPDFAFASEKLAVFVDGCFWHKCPRCFTKPVANAAFWEMKLAANVARDRRVKSELGRRGWRVVRVWEHDVRRTRAVGNRILRALGRSKTPQEPE